MGSNSSWIRDKVVVAVKADVAENGGDADEVIWQLSKELGRMVQFGGEIDAGERFQLEDGVIGNLDAGDIGLRYLKPEQCITEPTREMLTEALTPARLAGLEPIASGGPGFDIVKRPSHYTEGRKYEPKDVIRDWGLNYNLGSATKYISRSGKKDDIIQDLEKAVTFIQFEIDALNQERSDESSKS